VADHETLCATNAVAAYRELPSVPYRPSCCGLTLYAAHLSCRVAWCQDTQALDSLRVFGALRIRPRHARVAGGAGVRYRRGFMAPDTDGERLAAEKHYFDAVLDCMSDGVLVCDTACE